MKPEILQIEDQPTMAKLVELIFEENVLSRANHTVVSDLVSFKEGLQRKPWMVILDGRFYSDKSQTSPEFLIREAYDAVLQTTPETEVVVYSLSLESELMASEMGLPYISKDAMMLNEYVMKKLDDYH